MINNLSRQHDKGPLFTGIHQIGIVVKDLKKTIKNFSDLYGVNPWNIWQYDSSIVDDMTVYGKRLKYKMLVATCKSSNIDYEIIEPLDNKSVYYDFIFNDGEGLHHINYISSDFDKVMKFFKNHSIKVIQFGNLLGKHKYVYFDTQQELKHIVEISKSLPGFVRLSPLDVYPSKNKKLNISCLYKKIEYIGVITQNFENTVKVYMDKYNLEPTSFYNFNIKNNDLEICSYHKSEKGFNCLTAEYMIGKERIVIIQPTGSEELFSDFLGNFKEGLHHLGFSVKNFNKTIDYFISLGLKIIVKGKYQGRDFAFINTYDHLKFNICIF